MKPYGENRTVGGDISGPEGQRFKATVTRTDPDGEGSEIIHENDYRTEYRAQKASEAAMKREY